MRKLDLETPVLLVDHERLDQNIRRMQRLASDAGVALRPHTKAHKCPDLAKIQLAEGASGICAQKLGEAEVMVKAGIKDIFITNHIVEATKIQRLVKLEEKATVKIAVDSMGNAETISKVASHERPVPVLVEMESGMRRCGLPFSSAAKLAKRISNLNGVILDGIMTYEGQVYRITNSRQRSRVAKRAAERLVELAKRIRKEGIDVPTVSCGSTPSAATVTHVPGITEIQPGNYVFYDLNQVELGVAKLDNCALRVMASVISTPGSNRVVVDAGTKAFSHDKGRFPKPCT